MAPFARGSVSLRGYPHEGLDAAATVAELCEQARLAVAHGFDGVMTSEHHAGFAGYLPNPLQLAGFLLDSMPAGWAAPCPLLLPLRPVALVAEETAWLAARYPGRVGLGVAAGALQLDFDVMDTTMDDLVPRFAAGLERVTALLSGRELDRLAGDRALAECVERPVPVVSAAASMTAARRAARVGAGLLFDSLVPPARVRALVDEYHAHDGTGPCILIRRAWLGEPPRELVDEQLGVYRNYAPTSASSQWGGNEMISGETAEAVAHQLHDAQQTAGADALNLRVHVPGVSPAVAREQITRLGEEVVPLLKRTRDQTHREMR